MSDRTCGTCSLCCKLWAIPELNKPIDTWCRHARPGKGGCSIYPDRPVRCRGFHCGWLSGAPQLGDEWFPARCKMYTTPHKPPYSPNERGILVSVDPGFPDAWRRKPYYEQLLEWAQRMVVEIRIGRRCIRLDANGSELDVTQIYSKWLEKPISSADEVIE